MVKFLLFLSVFLCLSGCNFKSKTSIAPASMFTLLEEDGETKQGLIVKDVKSGKNVYLITKPSQQYMVYQFNSDEDILSTSEPVAVNVYRVSKKGKLKDYLAFEFSESGSFYYYLVGKDAGWFSTTYSMLDSKTIDVSSWKELQSNALKLLADSSVKKIALSLEPDEEGRAPRWLALHAKMAREAKDKRRREQAEMTAQLERQKREKAERYARLPKTVKFCNETRALIYTLAIGFYSPEKKEWLSEGSWSIRPKKCGTLLHEAIGSEIYVAGAYALEPPEKKSGDVWVDLFTGLVGLGSYTEFGGNTYFCVKNNAAFNITGRTKCISRGYSRRGFRQVPIGTGKSVLIELYEGGRMSVS